MRRRSVYRGLKFSFIFALPLAFLLFATTDHTQAIDFNNGEPVEDTGMSLQGSHVRLSLPQELNEDGLYLLFYSPDPNFNYNTSTLLGATQRDYYVDPISIGEHDRVFYRTLKFPNGLAWVMDEVMIEDFEDGTVILNSYPGQDQQPNAWEITSIYTYDSTLFSLVSGMAPTSYSTSLMERIY
jgi:hypothetical protein